MRTPIIAGNWKMHKTVKEALVLATQLRELLAGVTAVETVLCPPFTALYAVREVLNGSAIHLGAQTMHWEKQGAFTGEIAPAMLTDSGCEYVIIGHSERRQYFAESDTTVNKKM